MKRLLVKTFSIGMSVACAGALFCSASASAEVIVVGSPAATYNGNRYPFGSAYLGEYQQVYDATAFPGSLKITGLEFYNTSYDSGSTEMNAGTLTIALSTTSANQNTLSNNYALNIGGDNTTVFNGELHRNWAFGDTLQINFDTPFTYVRENGNLLLDVTVTVASRTSAIYFDVNYDGTVMGRVFNYDGNPSIGSGVDNLGLVTGFITGSVPEIDPAGAGSVFALISSALGLLERRRLKAG